MKKLSITVVAILFVGLAMAQPPKGGDFKGPKGPDLEKMQIVLELTDDQMVQWEALHEKHQAEMEVKRELIQKEQAARMEKMRADRKADMEAHQNELKKILTAEQFKKFEAMRPEHPGPNSRMEGSRGQGPNQKGECKGDQSKQFNKSDCSTKAGKQNKGKK